MDNQFFQLTEEVGHDGHVVLYVGAEGDGDGFTFGVLHVLPAPQSGLRLCAWQIRS
jgi:hypothetical protein